MSDGPNIWDVNDDITLEVFIGDPYTGLGLIDHEQYAELTIRRDSDAKWWTGSAWSDTRTILSLTEADATNEPGRYFYILSGTTANTIATRYVFYVSISAPSVTGSAFEAHVSREQDVHMYESEPE